MASIFEVRPDEHAGRTGYTAVISHAEERRSEIVALMPGFLMRPRAFLAAQIDLAHHGFDSIAIDRPDDSTIKVSELRTQSAVDVLSKLADDGYDQEIICGYSLAGADMARAGAKLIGQEIIKAAIFSHSVAEVPARPWFNPYGSFNQAAQSLTNMIINPIEALKGAYDSVRDATEMFARSPCQVLGEALLSVFGSAPNEVAELIAANVPCRATYGLSDSVVPPPFWYECIKGVEHVYVYGGHERPAEDRHFVTEQVLAITSKS